MSINQPWQSHVEFFITSPQGHHAVSACVSCCLFSTPASSHIYVRPHTHKYTESLSVLVSELLSSQLYGSVVTVSV
ncbi:hypothetical protein EXN66_Car020711 [Channa argus]|uniref:Uncharacterized protein n=1 Tax=Channa argus TaxID=215402 RepID=A0A6G1QQM3_CHAAH|nr:hypothetical protein EXN66_Car020711 [Channa argus]